jgi:mono/diheme cytochrome c family protein
MSARRDTEPQPTRRRRMDTMWRLWALLATFAFTQLRCGSKPFQQGEILYQNFCANCHMDDGSGLEGLIPPLAGADYLRDPRRQALLPCVIRHGISDTIVVSGVAYAQPMPGAPQLSDFEITNIINYINQAWGNDLGYTKYEKVKQALENCENFGFQ